MGDKVLLALSGSFEERLIKYFNPLELENVHKDLSSIRWPETIGEYFGNYLYALGYLILCPIPYDRTEEFNVLNVVDNPIPNIPHNWNRTVEEIFLERAEEIWDMDKPIRLWWSGGIDSTTALISLLRTKKSEHKLIIFMGDPCIEENPNFYETIKKMESNKELTIQWNDKHNIWSFDNWCDGSINVTGELGDQFYGNAAFLYHSGHDRTHGSGVGDIDAPWTDLFKWEDCNFLYGGDDARSEYHRPKCMEFLENFNKKCPFEVKNIFDFIWWLAFSIKWQWIENRLYIQVDNPSNYQNMISFYNSPEAQRWSIVNHDLKHKDSLKTYKWPSKEFIYNYNKDADYRDNKLKEVSIPKTLGTYNYVAQHSLIMTSGDYYKKTEETTYGIEGLDPEIAFLNKWDIFNKPVWQKWQNML